MTTNPFRQIFQAFADAGIRYLIVGGVAVNLHGYRRFTGDIDILLALSEENLEKTTKLMRKMGYVERLPVELKSLANKEQAKKWLEEKGMTAYTFQSQDELHLNIDILAAASLSFEEFNSRKVTVDLEDGLRVPVISLDDLFAMKREASRPEDLIDIEKLLSLREL